MLRRLAMGKHSSLFIRCLSVEERKVYLARSVELPAVKKGLNIIAQNSKFYFYFYFHFHFMLNLEGKILYNTTLASLT